MDSTIQTSFIPKQTITPRETRSSAGGGVGLFTVISLIILFISLAAAGGSYVYRSYLQNRLYSACNTTSSTQPNNDLLGLSGDIEKECGLYASLEEMRRRLNDERLQKMQRLDTKMKLATVVLGAHQSLSPLFELLSTTTLKTIRYTKFGAQNGRITLAGVASGYEDIAVQSNVLNDMKAVKNALFSNLDLDQYGNVTFTLDFSVDPTLLRYEPRVGTASSTN